MEPEVSLPHSQVPATCPYPEPSRSSPYPTAHFLEIHLNINLQSTPGSPKWSLCLLFPHQTLYTPLLSPIRAACRAHLDFVSRTISGVTPNGLYSGRAVSPFKQPNGHYSGRKQRVEVWRNFSLLFNYLMWFAMLQDP